MGETESVAPPPQQELSAPPPAIEQKIVTISPAPVVKYVDPLDRYQALIVRVSYFCDFVSTAISGHNYRSWSCRSCFIFKKL